MIRNICPLSFKGYIPVSYYIKYPANKTIEPVVDKNNLKKCNSFTVRNLNGTSQNMKNESFVQLYKSYDKDYSRIPKVHSVYDMDSSVVYLVTGSDTDIVRNMAKPIGVAKGKAMDKTGSAKSFEASQASREYFKKVKLFLEHDCKRLKSEDGKNLSLNMYFSPKYNKKDELTGFNFVNARFVKEENNS